jgi:ubiquinone/menaquinone biosynthesis C-methylase UbiE
MKHVIRRNRLIGKGDIDTLDLTERVRIEAQITDARAANLHLAQYRTLNLETYRAMFAWRRSLFDFLGDVSGKQVLDVCCGYSMTPVLFALAGATVVANDVAPLTLEQVRRVAQMHGVEDRIDFYCGPAEQLPYPDNSFDIIYGGAAIHHLWIPAVGPEFARVLRSGGRGGFQDPLGHNRILEFARDYLNYGDKHPEKGTDRPLTVADITTFGNNFSTHSWRGFDFLAMAPRVSHALYRFRRPLEALDTVLLSTLRPLQRYARFAVTLVANE